MDAVGTTWRRQLYATAQNALCNEMSSRHEETSAVEKMVYKTKHVQDDDEKFPILARKWQGT
jgi:hypothetical protein